MSEKNKKCHGSILVVDDEWLVRWSLEKTLLKHEFDVISIDSATEALELIKTKPIDFLITDLKMPEINGLKLIQAMKESNPKGKSILITAFGRAKIKKQTEKLGALLVEKPFDVEMLVSEIAKEYKISN